MSQNSLVLPTSGIVSGLTMTQDMNNALNSLVTLNSGADEPSPTYAYMLWADTTTNLLNQRDSANASWIVIGKLNGAPGYGHCRLTKSGTNLLLSPCNGNLLTIDGSINVVPSAGVTLAPTALSVGTTYFIYAYMSSGTMTLEASTTGHSTDSTTGMEIKTGDSTRTLVGMARIITGPAWADTDAQRFVLSYFNRRGVSGKSAFTADRTSTSATYAEINSEIRNEFLTWPDEIVQSAISGRVSDDTINGFPTTSIGFDGTTAEDTFSVDNVNPAATNHPIAAYVYKNGLSEGYHYATLLGSVSAGTGTWHGSGTAGGRTVLTTALRG